MAKQTRPPAHDSHRRAPVGRQPELESEPEAVAGQIIAGPDAATLIGDGQGSALQRREQVSRLQRELGNSHVQRVLAQRDGDYQLTMPQLGDSLYPRRQPPTLNIPRLQLRLLNLSGISRLRPLSPAPPWLSAAPAPDAEAEEPEELWSLEFDLKISPQSALGRSLAQQEAIEHALSGDEAHGTPLALRLSNAAINLLAATPQGRALRHRLHLDNVSFVLNPVDGLYGATATFRF